LIAAASGGKYFLRFGIMVVLARLLSPEEFGLVAILTAVFSVGAVFQELGLSAATVQRTNVSVQAISTLFWINTGIGGLLTIAFAVLAPMLANFYGRPELTLLCRVTAATFVLNGLAVQHRALLQRHMQFGAQARVDLLSSIAGGICALLLAWRGCGYWSLAGQILVTDATTLLLLIRATRFVPIRPAMTADVWEMLRFGSSLFGFNVLHCVSQNLYIALLGKTVGATAAGIYTRGFALASIPQGFLYSASAYVALPKLSKIKGVDLDFASFYYRGIQLLTLVTAPIAAFFAIFGDLITLCVYGQQWGEVAALIQIFSLGLAVAPILHSMGQIFVSRGEPHRMLRWGLVSSSVMTTCTVLGLHWGPQGAAWGWSLSMVVLLWPCVAYTVKGTAISVRGLISAVWRLYFAAALMIPIGLFTRHLLRDNSVWLQLPISLAVSLLAYLVLSYFILGQKSVIDSVLRSAWTR
jgi:O-antigen/teichoic acid export membrane protein